MPLRRVVAFSLHLAIALVSNNPDDLADPQLLAQWCSPDVLAQRRPRFLEIYQRYHAHHDAGKPRKLDGIEESRISVDFELEKGYVARGTSRHVLIRGGIQVPGLDLTPQNVSQWFSVGIDGCGHSDNPDEGGGIGFQQQMGLMRYEISTKVMRPADVVNSDLLSTLNSFLASKGWLTRGRPQFTVGLPLGKVSELLSLGEDQIVSNLLRVVTGRCRKRGGCTPEYQGLVVMAGMTLNSLRSTVAQAHGACLHPKRAVRPWLVRTNFGDIMQYLQRNNLVSGDIVADVLFVLGDDGEAPLFGKHPHIMEYMNFEDMAEFSGFVRGRDLETCLLARQDAVEMPTDVPGLRRLAKHMLHRRRFVEKKLANRTCSVRGVEVEDRSLAFSTRDWLLGVARGEDIMSDHHSEASQASYSHTLWRSMGKWRLQGPRDQRVYLECRHHELEHCIAGTPPHGSLYEERMSHVARTLMRLDGELG